MQKILLVIDLQDKYINKYNEHTALETCAYVEEKRKRYDIIIRTKTVDGGKWYKCIFDDEYDITLPRKSYSCFDMLERHLGKKDKVLIDVCGISADCCVLATCFDLQDNGYKFRVLENLTSASCLEHKEIGLDIIKRCLSNGEIIESKKAYRRNKSNGKGDC